DDDPEEIAEAVEHIKKHQLHEQHPLLHHLAEHSIEWIIFISLVALNGLEFTGYLPGYLDWIKKVMSWILMLLILYKVDITKLVLNNKRQWANITIIAAFFIMHLKTLVSFAKTQTFENNNFIIFDLFAFVLNHQYFFTVTLFYIGAILLLIPTAYLAFTTPAREGSIYYQLTRFPFAKTVPQKLKRIIKLYVIFMIFFFTLFNRFLEWLAISIDTAVFIVTVVLFLFVIANTRLQNQAKEHKSIFTVFESYFGRISVWLFFLALFSLAFVKPFLPPDTVMVIWYIVIGAITVTALYDLIVGLKDHLTSLEHMSASIDSLTAKMLKLFKYPATLPLAISGLYILQQIVELALYIIPNITGEAATIYTSESEKTLLNLFGQESIITQHLFTLNLHEKIVTAIAYATSLIGSAMFFIVPILLWALYYRNRSRHMSALDINVALHEKSKFNRFMKGSLILAIPLSIISLAAPVLKIIPLTTLTSAADVGVILVAQPIILSIESLQILLVCATVAALTLWYVASRKRFSHIVWYSALWLMIAQQVAFYVVPYIQSLSAYVIELLKPSGSIITTIAATSIGLFFVLDILLVYVLGVIIVCMFVIPVKIKSVIIKILQKIPSLKHILLFASELQHIEYYPEVKAQIGANVYHHVAHYIRQQLKEGHDLDICVYHLKVHDYPQQVIAKAIDLLIEQGELQAEIADTKPQVIHMQNVKEAIVDATNALNQGNSPAQIIEEFNDKYTFEELKIAVKYATGDLKKEITRDSIQDVLLKETQAELELVKDMMSKRKSPQFIIDTLIRKGYEPEEAIKTALHATRAASHLSIEERKKLREKLLELLTSEDIQADLLKIVTKYPYSAIIYELTTLTKSKRQQKFMQILQMFDWIENVRIPFPDMLKKLSAQGWNEKLVVAIYESKSEHAKDISKALLESEYDIE
ncbi:MAG TPA: hypothetical protein VK158_00845, partial [Acidobacteriota bacterium]|nr:hypothetical protein [Acidobacteriota bacterium]